MEEIRKVLDLPIQKGYINWEKLEEKIHAGIVFLNSEEGKKVGLGDEVDFECKAPDEFGIKQRWAYKLLAPRFYQGKLYCSGFMLGRFMSFTVKEPIWFPDTRRMF